MNLKQESRLRKPITRIIYLFTQDIEKKTEKYLYFFVGKMSLTINVYIEKFKRISFSFLECVNVTFFT